MRRTQKAAEQDGVSLVDSTPPGRFVLKAARTIY